VKRGGRAQVTSAQAAQASALRRDMTDAERKLWKAIRARLPVESTHFRRQVPIGRYIVDFCSHGLMLIIELDGEQHGFRNNRARDQKRTAFLNSQGYRVLQFSNRDVMLDIDVVLDTIFLAVATPTLTPPHQGEGDCPALGHKLNSSAA
jgi:very-short-patch-repair endonuclease